MPLQNPLSPKYFPKGRGKCRECGGARYREGLCREHLFEQRRRTYTAKKPIYDKECAHCKEKFRVSRPMQRYCSPRCSTLARNIREQVAPVLKGVPCTRCGKTFDQFNSTSKFCSTKCADRYRDRGLQYKFKLQRGLIDAICEQCATHFKHKVRASQRKARFCSSQCFYKANSGSSSPLKRDGVFHVPAQKLWRELCGFIRTRDGNRCTACGGEQISRKRHPVDHIVPRRMVFGWGNDPHMIANLVTLCRVCHGKKGAAEIKILKGDFVGFLLALSAMKYPMHRVEEAFRQFGLPMQMFQTQGE